MNKKGFTLIELLAIIVILAIIAVITVPIILNIIDNAKSGAEKDSIVGYGKAVELAYTQYQYEMQLNGSSNLKVTKGNNWTLPTNGSQVEFVAATNPAVADFTGVLAITFDGETVVCSGTNTIVNGKVKLTGCTVNGNGSYIYGNGKACPTPTGSATTDCD